MAHNIDGYSLAFTSRKSWKAKVTLNEESIEIVPVTWTRGFRYRGAETFLEVWFRNQRELKQYNARSEPFIVATASAKDFRIHPHSFKKFVALYEVRATGTILSEDSLETRVIRRLGAPNSSPSIESRITRISFNSNNWRKPTGEAAKQESSLTFNQEFGYGHEDWLFRDEWQIDGWRYAFLQGVSRSRAKLLREGQSFNVTLFTVQPGREKKRRYVASIAEVECLSDTQAERALQEFEKHGWLAVMREEVKAIQGIDVVLHRKNSPADILNVRFRLENVKHFANSTFAQLDDPIMGFDRYQLYNDTLTDDGPLDSKRRMRAGSEELPTPLPFQRPAFGPAEVSPEHSAMQRILMEELKAEFPDARVLREKNYIDVIVQRASETYLYEIKTDLSSRSVIRNAVGQLLEYGFYHSDFAGQRVHLVAVGRRLPSADDERYLQLLREKHLVPISYRVVSIDE